MATYDSYIVLLCEEIRTVWRGPQSLVYAKQKYKRSNPNVGCFVVYKEQRALIGFRRR